MIQAGFEHGVYTEIVKPSLCATVGDGFITFHEYARMICTICANLSEVVKHLILSSEVCSVFCCKRTLFMAVYSKCGPC